MTTATATQTITTKCAKCSGKGHILAFQGIAGGVCFECKGAGKFVESVTTVKRRAARIEADKRKAHARMEANLDRLAPLHAVWEQRGDLIADRYPEIHEGAMVSIAAREELWEADMLWMQSVDNCRRNSGAIGY